MIKYFTLIVIAFVFSSCYMTAMLPKIGGAAKVITNPSAVVNAMTYGNAQVDAPTQGGIYSKVQSGSIVSGNALGKKASSAYTHSFFGLIGLGDASFETICKNGGITKISHVDIESKNILGFYARQTVFVYGE